MPTDMRSSCNVFFDEDRCLIVSSLGINWFGFAGHLRVELDRTSPALEIGRTVRAAWDALQTIVDETVPSPEGSWDFVADHFGVANSAAVRKTKPVRHEDHIRLVISELKGDNRSNRSADAIVIPLDVSDEELGAAVRRAMELTTS